MARRLLAAASPAVPQPSLWDAVPPKPAPTPKSLRTAPLPAGKRPARGARVMVEGETPGGETYAYMGAMICGREREYALLVMWDERDDQMAARRCVSVEQVRVVVAGE